MKIVGFYHNENFTKVKNYPINYKDKLSALLFLVSSPEDTKSFLEKFTDTKPKESVWTSLKESLEIIAEFCKYVIKFFKLINTVISNFSTISFWTCLCLALVGFLMYEIADVKQGKTIAVFAFVFYILVQVISFVVN